MIIDFDLLPPAFDAGLSVLAWLVLANLVTLALFVLYLLGVWWAESAHAILKLWRLRLEPPKHKEDPPWMKHHQ